MSLTDLHGVANTLLCRAQEQGFVIPRDFRDELARAGLGDVPWKEVLSLIASSLQYRHGRYYYVSAGAARLRQRVRLEQRQQRTIERAVERLIRQYRLVEVPVERREQTRIELVRPVQALTEDRQTLNLLTRDLSLTGVRLLASTSLQGQKLRVWLPKPGSSRDTFGFLVHILWSALVADGVYENGGLFLKVLTGRPQLLKITTAEEISERQNGKRRASAHR